MSVVELMDFWIGYLIVFAVFTEAIREYHDTRNGTVVNTTRLKDVKAGKRFVKKKDAPAGEELEVSDNYEKPKKGRPFKDNQVRPALGSPGDDCLTSVELEYENEDEMRSEDVKRISSQVSSIETENMFERIKKRNETSAVASSSSSIGNLGLYV